MRKPYGVAMQLKRVEPYHAHTLNCNCPVTLFPPAPCDGCQRDAQAPHLHLQSPREEITRLDWVII